MSGLKLGIRLQNGCLASLQRCALHFNYQSELTIMVCFSSSSTYIYIPQTITSYETQGTTTFQLSLWRMETLISPRALVRETVMQPDSSANPRPYQGILQVLYIILIRNQEYAIILAVTRRVLEP
jgi:hypothetical protein